MIIEKSRGRPVILPWEIVLVDPPDTSFLGFYEDWIRQKIQERELQKAYAGKSKDSLDQVNISLCMRDAPLHILLTL